MAQDKKESRKIVINNKTVSTATSVVEQVVIGDALVADPNVVNPGVNSATNKN